MRLYNYTTNKDSFCLHKHGGANMILILIILYKIDQKH